MVRIEPAITQAVLGGDGGDNNSHYFGDVEIVGGVIDVKIYNGVSKEDAVLTKQTAEGRHGYLLGSECLLLAMHPKSPPVA